jgi:hypothetical protein
MKDTIKLIEIDPTWMQQTGGYAKDMTLRDHFAGLAMPMLATEFYAKGRQLESGTVAELISKVAYVFADEMLKERNK